jgi:transcriptional regulator with XRE-family HTH domain
VARTTKEFADLLKVYLEYRETNQYYLSQAAGLTPSYISRLVSGERKPSREVVVRIAKALDFDVGDRRYDLLLETAGYRAAESVISFACMEIHLINELFMQVDSKTQTEVRLALRLLADGMDSRVKERQ